MADVVIERGAKPALISASARKGSHARGRLLDNARSSEFHDVDICRALDKKVIDVDRFLLAETASTADCLGHGRIIVVLRTGARRVVWCHKYNMICDRQVAVIQLVSPT
jgi:hypothetical protein